MLGLRLNLHNLLKFQGLGASHGFEAQPLWFRGTEVRGLPERRHSASRRLLPEEVEANLLLKHLFPGRQVLRDVAEQ